MAAKLAVRFTRFSSTGLRAQVTGPRSLETTIEYWEAIARRVGEECPARLLVIDELQGPELTAAQWETLVQKMLGYGLRAVRIAHVKPAGLGQAEYCEIYANIAGFDARAFVDEGEAERWLRYGSEPDGPGFGGSGDVRP
ncbi:MAG: hypothetical protein ACJ8GK_03955 [Luteimonas sp.]